MKTKYELLVGSRDALRSIGKALREKKKKYKIVRVDFKNYNSYWKGTRGLALKVTREVYHSLYN